VSATYQVGTVNGYSPVDVTYHIASATTFDQTVKAILGKQPNIPGSRSLGRYWTLSNIGGTVDATADLTFHYLDSADLSAVTEPIFNYFKYNGSFTQVPATLDTTNNLVTAAGVSSFSDWTLAEPGAVSTGNVQYASVTYSVNESWPSIDVIVTRPVAAAARLAFIIRP